VDVFPIPKHLIRYNPSLLHHHDALKHFFLFIFFLFPSLLVAFPGLRSDWLAGEKGFWPLIYLADPPVPYRQ
jgi:hypothetical protein